MYSTGMGKYSFFLLKCSTPCLILYKTGLGILLCIFHLLEAVVREEFTIVESTTTRLVAYSPKLLVVVGTSIVPIDVMSDSSETEVVLKEVVICKDVVVVGSSVVVEVVSL